MKIEEQLDSEVKKVKFVSKKAAEEIFGKMRQLREHINAAKKTTVSEEELDRRMMQIRNDEATLTKVLAENIIESKTKGVMIRKDFLERYQRVNERIRKGGVV